MRDHTDAAVRDAEFPDGPDRREDAEYYQDADRPAAGDEPLAAHTRSEPDADRADTALVDESVAEHEVDRPDDEVEAGHQMSATDLDDRSDLDNRGDLDDRDGLDDRSGLETRTDIEDRTEFVPAHEAGGPDGTYVGGADAGEPVVATATPVEGTLAAADERTGPASTTESAAPTELKPGDAEPVPATAAWTKGGPELADVRDRWREVQLRFIDDPSGSAAEAQSLVGEAIDRYTQYLATRRQELDSWRSAQGDDTEVLRAAVREYRDFLTNLID